MYIGGDREGLADWKLESCIPETKVLVEGDGAGEPRPRDHAALQEKNMTTVFHFLLINEFSKWKENLSFHIVTIANFAEKSRQMALVGGIHVQHGSAQ